MKIIKGIAIVSFLSLALVSCKDAKHDNTTEEKVVTEKIMADNAKMETTNLAIDGMTCAMGCAKAIEKDLNKLDGVKEAKVDFDTKIATVSFDANVENLASLTKTIEATADGESYKVTESKLIQ